MMMRSKINMMEATRLTRQGRLEEAMALLRGTLSGEGANPPNDDSNANHDENNARISTVNLPPLTHSKGLARLPFERGFPTRGNMGQPSPATTGAILDRVRKINFALGLEKLTGRGVRPQPPPLPAGARFDEHSFANSAGSRSYKLYVPSHYDGRPVPLLVMLHGCTQSPDDFAAGTRMNEVAEERTFLVAYPAQAQSANASKCWNWFNGGDQRRDQGEPSLIAGITHQIMREFQVDPARVFVAGLSAGGAAAAIMGTTYPDLYAAIGVHSGLACGAARDVPSAFSAMRQGAPVAGMTRRAQQRVLPAIVFHGDRDQTVNPINGDQVIAQSGTNTNLKTTVSRGQAPGGISYTRSIHSEESGRTVLEHWVLHGVGHAWSGGGTAGSYTEPRGPDASREMMRFFLQHSTELPRLLPAP